MATLSARNSALLVQRPIAACVASVCALAGSASALAGTVTSCLDDHGPGTLRSVVAAAAEGEVISFAGTLTCSTISIEAGELDIEQNSLTIDGAALINGVPSRITVDAYPLQPPYIFLGYGRVFNHRGTGTLTLKNLTATRGSAIDAQAIATFPFGGCIVSKGSVTLEQVEVSHCKTYSAFTDVKYYSPVGGAIAARNDVTLTNSSVTHSKAYGKTDARGGGIYAKNVSLTNSTVSYNTSSSSVGKSYGGGIFAKGNLTINVGSVSYNTVDGTNEAAGGGVYVGGDLDADATGGFSIMRNNSVVSTFKTARGGGSFVHGNLSSSGQNFIKYNSVASKGGEASGGGLYVGGNLTLSSGVLTANTAGSTGGVVRGGGARALGTIDLQYSTISDNAANDFGFGGGLVVAGTTAIRHSTISGNSAAVAFGGVYAFSQAPAALSLTMDNSTLSGNTADNRIGALYTNFGHVNLHDTTIAFNSANSAGQTAGVQLMGPSTALLQNTLMSNNSVGAVDTDLTTSPNVTFSAASSTNLIRATAVANLPAGSTTFGLCPHLGPLRFNGGPTPTHAPQSHSPAIDHGGPTTYASKTGNDQRGSGYSRVLGPIGDPNPVADIGAYEVQQGDVVFDTGFDACN